MNKNDFKVGQIVYGKPGINISRYNKEIVEGTVEKVGNKFIDVKFGYGRPHKYYIENLRQKTEYAEDYYLYLDKQQILDEEEKTDLIRDIKIKFNKEGANELDITKKLIDELNLRIYDAENREEHEEAFALENFLEWVMESFVY